MIQYKIPITGVKVSTNKIYAGTHWSKRKQIKDNVLDYAAAFCRPLKAVDTYPVEIHYQFLFLSRPLDTLNTAYLAKCFEDSLVSLGVIKDDSPKYVKKTILEVPLPVTKKGQKTFGSSIAEIGPGTKKEDWLIITINKI